MTNPRKQPLLAELESPQQLQTFSAEQLEALAAEIREVLCDLVATRPAHFASNLGVVELCLALHATFDFREDRLIWDTGHQIYPHKLVTGRYPQFETIRTRGGLMGYPNPHESVYDLFMTGHAGSSVSTVMGVHSGDHLLGRADRKAIAVIGDGAFPSGIVHEALNNAAGLKQNLLVILNDNKMSICPRVGGLAEYLDRLRANPLYTGLKEQVRSLLAKLPLVGDPVEHLLAHVKEGVKAGLVGGMLFEELGFRYFGPVDGHDIASLRQYLEMVQDLRGPVLLHVVTAKGQGYKPAAEDPVFFHTPPTLEPQPAMKSGKADKAYTNYARDAIQEQMRRNEKVTVLTAAMCQGNKLEPVREEFSTRFFDVGICESHAVAFAAGQAKAGLRPIVDIYSTFLQRSFDQIFQEVCLQNLPVVFMLDRAGLTGPDGPTHHGLFDLGYQRLFPNMVVMAPGDAQDLVQMLDFALEHDGPTSIRYPKTTAAVIDRTFTRVELGQAETLRTGADGVILSCGAMLEASLAAADQLQEEGLDVGVINARFIKPLDANVISAALQEHAFVITVEEAALMTGFGSAVLELANDRRLRADHVVRLGIPDRFIEHGTRGELLADLGLDASGIANACRTAAAQTSVSARQTA